MWLKPGGRALDFTAIEEFQTEQVAFSWRARFPLLPFVTMHVVDRYAAGEGLLEVRVLGLPVSRMHGRATAEGEAMRYLAELPWVPHAIDSNARLDWRELGARTVEAATQVGSSRVAVRLEFDADDDIVSASAQRPRVEGKSVATTPWTGVYSDYAVVGGVWLPTRATVRWELTDGPFTYWDGTITGFELLNRR